MPNPEFKALFATPLSRFELENVDELNSALVNLIEGLYEGDQGETRPNDQKSWRTARNFLAGSEPAVIQIRQQIHQCLLSASQQWAAQADFSQTKLRLQGWGNVNPPGAFNLPHSHPDAFWSGVYYVNCPEPNAAIQFLDPRDASGCHMLMGMTFPQEHSHLPKAGELLIFPSWLRHWVFPNASTQNRISIAFNATLVP